MRSLGPMVKKIQGLSGTADFSQVQNLLKLAGDALQAESEQYSGLSDPTLCNLYLLYSYRSTPANEMQARAYVLIVARFISCCDPEQIRLAPNKFISICKSLKDLVLLIKEPLLRVAPMLTAIRKLQSSGDHLTALHPDFLQLCLLAKCYKIGLSILAEDIFELDQPRALFLYCYYGGMICIGQKHFQEALELLHIVVTAPMASVNAIAVEAYKKYVLVSLIHHGQLQFSTSLPKSVAPKILKKLCQPYVELGNSYQTGDMTELETHAQANIETFDSDNNLGLVKQVLASMYKRNIKRLSQMYTTLSLSKIADTVQLNSPKEAEMHVLQMIQDGEIHATMDQKDGLVTFVEGPEQNMMERVDSSIQRIMALSKKLTAMNEAMALSPDPSDRNLKGRRSGEGFDFHDFS